jgi:chitinase
MIINICHHVSTDWEYPGYAEHSGTPDDIETYPLLLEELRNALDNLEEETGKHYGITTALPWLVVSLLAV